MVSLLIGTVGIPVILYLLLWSATVRHSISAEAERRLSELLGARVTIGSVEIEPFTRLNIDNVTVSDSLGRRIATVRRLGGGISPVRFLTSNRLVVSDVEIIGPELHLWRDSLSAPLNVEPILARLKSDKPDSGPVNLTLGLHTAVVRRGRFTYHVLSEQLPDSGCFSPHHITVSDVNADVAMPRLGPRDISVRLKRLSMREASGLHVNNIRAALTVTDTLTRLADVRLEMPVSRLLLSDITVTYPSLDSLASALASTPHRLALRRGSRIYPPDFAPLLPPLARLATPVDMEMELTGTTSAVTLTALRLQAHNSNLLSLSASGSLLGMAPDDSLRAEISPLSVGLDGSRLLDVADAFGHRTSALERLLPALGQVLITGRAGADEATGRLSFDGTVATALGSVSIDGQVAHHDLEGSVTGDSLQLGTLLGSPLLGPADFTATVSARQHGPSRAANASLVVDRLSFKGHEYRNLTVDAALDNERVDAAVEVADNLLGLYAEASGTLPAHGLPSLKLNAGVRNADLAAMGLWDKYPGYRLSADIDADLADISASATRGMIAVSGLTYAADSAGERGNLALGPLTVTASGRGDVELTSDVVEAELHGRYDVSALAADFMSLLRGGESHSNQFSLRAKVFENERFFDFLNLPVKPLYTATVTGEVRPGMAWLSASAPYLRKGNKLIRGSQVDVELSRRSSLVATTTFPTADGDARLTASASLTDAEHATARMEWAIDRRRAFKGLVAFDARLLHDADGRVSGADVSVLPSQVVFNDSAWRVCRARILATPGQVAVDSLHIGRSSQSVTISGVASADSASRLNVALHNVDLDYLFATLRLGEYLQFGGVATGNVSGAALLSRAPILRTDHLHVENFSYNHGTIGHADIAARWDNQEKAIVLGADFTQSNGGATRVDGLIGPGKPGRLDINIRADRTPVGFLNRILAAFAADVTGEASGLFRVYGTLKHVQLGGALRAHNVGMRILPTNCTYFTDDSVTFTPGSINLPDLTVRDAYGHTARLNGAYRHEFLKNGHFDFNVTKARRMLVYNVGRSDEQNWSGRVFGSGSVNINGRSGVVNVGADMTTTRGSEFTFELSDRAEAGEYSFLTFRDSRAAEAADLHELRPGSPELDRIMAGRVSNAAASASSTAFNMDLKVNVTPDTKMTLVMDPVSGDKITAYGSGTPDIIYNSGTDGLSIFGDYTIDRGDYNFTLKDIIIKNFKLESGSRVYFGGDLDHINLDINAIYSLKANLSDLDESFLNDKEVGRTSVTVQALLSVDGPLNTPGIHFDLRFPTLTSDVDRKVHAIISTEEMMNRQIIYLLALNRFYTPDYMAASSSGGGRGGELVSVASSTISSQLSNILGQISDKFSLAPNLRSDAGDFSDVEFDLALSSTLLNNRLLLNGNFGYRDQMLNNNQFIGDFDIEYLLNRGGNWRLKAYNHFNDRNLYVRTAMTTQGLGIVFRHDFDNLFRRRRRQPVAPASEPSDSVKRYDNKTHNTESK